MNNFIHIILTILLFLSLCQPLFALASELPPKKDHPDGCVEFVLWAPKQVLWFDITYPPSCDEAIGYNLVDLDERAKHYGSHILIDPATLGASKIRLACRMVEMFDDQKKLSIELILAIAKWGDHDRELYPKYPTLRHIRLIHFETIQATNEWRQFTAQISPTLWLNRHPDRDAGAFVLLLFSKFSSPGPPGRTQEKL